MIGVLLLTYNRTEYAIKTIQALKENWKAPDYGIYIADGGSSEKDMEIIKQECGDKLIGFHTSDNGKRVSCGLNWNLGIEAIFSKFDTILHLEDDYILARPFDATDFVNILKTRQEVGIIRLGHIVIDLTGKTISTGEYRFLEMDLKAPFSYSNQPHLKHKRFYEHYGNFQEKRNTAGEAEAGFDGLVRLNPNPGPKIWIPFDIGSNGLFGHIGTLRTEDMILKEEGHL